MMPKFTVKMKYSGERHIEVEAEDSFDAFHMARSGHGEISEPAGMKYSFRIIQQKEP